jgi:hypothetical protein
MKYEACNCTQWARVRLMNAMPIHARHCIAQTIPCWQGTVNTHPSRRAGCGKAAYATWSPWRGERPITVARSAWPADPVRAQLLSIHHFIASKWLI